MKGVKASLVQIVLIIKQILTKQETYMHHPPMAGPLSAPVELLSAC